MKAIVIGCGRVGSSIAHSLRADQVVAVDGGGPEPARRELDGGFIVGHGMDTSVLRRAGMDMPTPWSSRPTATTQASSSAGPQKPSGSTASSSAC
jgi:hypothetical protein